ncbi:MAG: helix-turn-helix domain-containing protein [Leptospirillum sp.]
MSEEEFQRESEEDGLKEKLESCGAKTIGEFLLYEREKQGLSLDDIDEISRIGPRWLEAIDKGEWSAYPSLIYAKGHIRGYAGVLNLDGSRIISYFEQELKNAFPDETFHIHPVKNINQIYQPTSMGNRGGTRYKYLLLGILGVLFVSLIISKVVHRNTRIPVSVVPQALPTIPPATTTPVIPTPDIHPSGPPSSTPLAPLGSQSVSPPSLSPSEELSGKKTMGDSNPLPASSQGPKNNASLSMKATGKNRQFSAGAENLLKVEAVRDTWVGVQVDGRKKVEIPLDKGQWRIFHGGTFRVSTDDGGSLLLYLNKGKLGKAGPDDQPVVGKLIGTPESGKSAFQKKSR